LHASEFGVTTNNGFTTHEHLDEVYLIHMNGRVYDYRLGRFLSVDPIISNPANSQSINPYSYIGNNPLSGVDPTGYCDTPTGTHVCGTPAESIAGLSVNGNPAVSGSNTFLGAVKDYLKQVTNGSKPDNGNNPAISDKEGPSDTAKGPSIEGLKDWFTNRRAEWKQDFEDAFKSFTDSLNPRRLTRNEVEAELGRDTAQKAAAMGTRMGGDAYDATETVVETAAETWGLGKAVGLLGGLLGKAVKGPFWTSTKNKTPVENAYRHFKDHGAEFGSKNSVDYVKSTQEFLRNPPAGTLSKTRANGDIIRYHPNTNTFGVIDAAGAPRTMFKPDPAVHGKPSNLDYFHAQ
jgi:RHS repeat-associated protein